MIANKPFEHMRGGEEKANRVIGIERCITARCDHLGRANQLRRPIQCGSTGQESVGNHNKKLKVMIPLFGR